MWAFNVLTGNHVFKFKQDVSENRVWDSLRGTLGQVT